MHTIHVPDICCLLCYDQGDPPVDRIIHDFPEIPVTPSYSRAHDMAGVADVQDVFMLFGDSITQGSFEPEHRGFGLRLARMYLITNLLAHHSNMP